MSRSYIGRVSVATPSKTQQRAILRGLKAWHGHWDNDRQPYVREHDGRFLVDFPFTLGGGFGHYPAPARTSPMPSAGQARCVSSP